MSSDQQTPARLSEKDILALRGLRLPRVTLRNLGSRGIYCQPSVSIEHQHLAKRYVLRGVESGGAVSDLGEYCSFVDGAGRGLTWLQPVDSIAVNGVHAIVIAPEFVRMQMLRVQNTFDLLITRHSLESGQDSRRPSLKNTTLFYGRRGTLAMELWGKDSQYMGMVRPLFLSRSGEEIKLPAIFEKAALRLTVAVSCLGCRHSHLLQPKSNRTIDLEEVTVQQEVS